MRNSMNRLLTAAALAGALMAAAPAHAGFWSSVGNAFRDLGRQIASDWHTITSGHAVPGTGYRSYLSPQSASFTGATGFRYDSDGDLRPCGGAYGGC